MSATAPVDTAPGPDVITGHWPGGRVTFAGKPLDPARSLQIANHSPTGFGWGYSGSGPAQLALALLLELGINTDHARQLHQVFKADVIAPLPQADFTLPIAHVQAWIDRQP